MQGRTIEVAATPEAAGVRRLSWKLFLQFNSDKVLSTTEISDTVARCDTSQPEHESPTYSLESFSAGDFAEGHDIPQTRVPSLHARMCRETRTVADRTASRRGFHKASAYLLGSVLKAFILNREIRIGHIGSTECIAFLEQVTW